MFVKMAELFYELPDTICTLCSECKILFLSLNVISKAVQDGLSDAELPTEIILTCLEVPLFILQAQNLRLYGHPEFVIFYIPCKS